MISEFEFFHGAVLARMLHTIQQNMNIAPYSLSDNASYVIDGDKGIYMKYSSKRMSPWRFSFQRRHCEMIAEMERKLGEVFVILLCNDDGSVVLTLEELRQVVNIDGTGVQWVSAARNRKQMYLINGSDGKLAFKIGKDEFAEKIFDLTTPPAPTAASADS